MLKVVRAGNIVVLDVTIGARTTNRSSFLLVGTVSGQNAFDTLIRVAALCRGEKQRTKIVNNRRNRGLKSVAFAQTIPEELVTCIAVKEGRQSEHHEQ